MQTYARKAIRQAASVKRPVNMFGAGKVGTIRRMRSNVRETLSSSQLQGNFYPSETNTSHIFRSSDGNAPELSASTADGIRNIQGSGQTLPKEQRSFFESRFGTNFSGVRIHTDNRAATLARQVGARAFTLGNDVVFGSGEYQPNSLAGKRLMAHELTHVVQQQGGNKQALQRKPSGKTITKSTVAGIVNGHLVEYLGHVRSGVDDFTPPAKKGSTFWFLASLAGNLAWAATCLSGIGAAAKIAMSFGGAIIGAGTLKELDGGTATAPSLKKDMKTSVGKYVDNLKKKMPAHVDVLYDKFKSAGIDDADDSKQTLERRKVAWNYMFDNKVAPWENASNVASQTTKDISDIWSVFEPSWHATCVSIYGDMRYKGEKLKDKTIEIFLRSYVVSGVAKRTPAIEKENLYDITGSKEGLEFTLTGTKFTFPGGGAVTVPRRHPNYDKYTR